jgi:argininosuccinate lyase
MIPAMVPKRENMRLAATKGYATATDLADYLVNRGLPFRDAHDVVGKLVALAIEQNADLSELSIHQLRSCSDLIDSDVYDVLTLDGSVRARNHIGGTAPEMVRSAIAFAKAQLERRAAL